MDDRKRLFTIILIMTTICLAVAGVTMSILYNPAFEEQRARLVETAQSQARLIEAVARFDAIHSKEDHPKGSEAATLSQIIDAHKNYKGFGKTGEFTLARREGDSIVFLLSHRHYDFDTPKPVRFDSELAEPMRLALSGLSGSMVGLDYRRKKVLAAYEPIAELDYGIVAKIDLAEIRAPFVKAGVIAGFLAVLFIFAGAVLFLWISNPMIRRLRENEEKYRSLIANIPDVVWRSDREGNTTFISPKVKEIYGYLQEEIYKEGKRLWLDRIHPDDFEHVKDAYDLLFKGSEKFDVEYRIKRKDGNWIWLHDKSIGTYERDGEIYADGLFSDITEIKQAEEALWKSEREKGAILSNMSERVVHQDLEMRVLWANKAAAESVDSKPEELIKNHCYEIWHQRSEPCADCPILKSIETGQLHEGEIVFPDGRVWLIKGNPVKDASGKVVSIVEVAEDITERKLLEEALELSQNRYALAQRVANIGVWEWNIRSGEIYWSEQIEPMFGFGHGEFGGTYEAFIECVHPEDHLYVNDSVKAAVEKDKDYDIEHRIVWPDGTIHWLSEIGDVIHDENGNPIRMIGVVLDITERRQAAADFKRNYDALERFSRLSVERETKMVKLKEEVNELLSQLGREKKYKIVQ